MLTQLPDYYYNPKNVGAYAGATAFKNASKLKNIDGWLMGERPYTLHKAVKHKYPVRPYKSKTSYRQLQGDLVEMGKYASDNKGYRYLLTVIDIHSRRAWVRPLKSKEGKEGKKFSWL